MQHPILKFPAAVVVGASLLAVTACATSQELGPYAFWDAAPGGEGSSLGGMNGIGGLGAGGGSGVAGGSLGGTAGGGVTTESGGSGAGTGGAGTTAGGSSSSGGSASSTGGVGSSGAGGRPSTGGASSTGGTPACADADADGITDCVENGDNDPWTDPAVFNGLHVGHANQCSAAGNCDENDTFAEVTACMSQIDEQLDQHAGWDWDNPPDDICNSRYGFAPNWKNCDSSWAAQWEGCIHLKTAGPHCFELAGGSNEGCAALYFNGNKATADTQTGKGVKCFNVAAGDYALFVHYTMDNGSSSSMHLRYCDAAGGTTCTPTAAIPAAMLRTKCGP